MQLRLQLVDYRGMHGFQLRGPLVYGGVFLRPAALVAKLQQLIDLQTRYW
jgi:hypothetical protein